MTILHAPIVLSVEDILLNWVATNVPTVGLVVVAVWLTWLIRGLFADHKHRLIGVETSCKQLGENFTKLDQKVDNLDQKVTDLDHKVTSLEHKVDQNAVVLDQKIVALDEKVDQKITALDQKVDQKITALDQKVDQKITALDQKVDQKIDALDQKIDLRITRLEHKFDRKFIKLEHRFDRKFRGVDEKLDSLLNHFSVKKKKRDEVKQAYSPISLTETGRRILEDMGGKHYIDTNLNRLLNRVRQRNFRSKLDIQYYCETLLYEYLHDHRLVPVKDFIFNTPTYKVSETKSVDLDIMFAFSVMGLYLRDKYFERYPRLLKKR